MLIQLLRLRSDELNENPEVLNDDLMIDALGAVLSHTLRKIGFSDHLEEAGINPWISLWLVNDETIRELNRTQRDKDETTDVLSFPTTDLTNGIWPEEPDDTLSTEPPLGFESEAGYSWEIGTIVISLPRAQSQAETYGHHLLREICFLAVHGMLHLLGYDHDHENSETDQTWQMMEKLQEGILTDAGITRDLTDDTVESLDFQKILDNEDVEVEEDAISSTEWEELLWDAESLGFGATPVETDAVDLVPEGFVSGFISLLGRTNAGKSTLINVLTGLKVAITSHKSQTTRNNIRAVVNHDDAQLIFTDTPGIFKATNKLNEFMRESAMRALQDADVGVLLVDAQKGNITAIEHAVCEEAEKLGKPLILLLTKVDLIAKETLLPVIARFSKIYPFQAIIPISALKEDGIGELIAEIKRILPEGPRYYPRESSTDQTERSLSAELVREQVLYYLHQEIPHGIAVQIDSFEELGPDELPVSDPSKRTLVRIIASIVCEREAHKGIIIGKEGQSLKRIGSSARRAIEQMLGVQIYLDVHVKVRENWQNRPDLLRDLGYGSESGSGPEIR